VKAKRISPDAMACLVNYDWPGNVRELENALERAVVLCASEVIGLEDLPESIPGKRNPRGSGQSQIPWCNKGLEKTANPKRPARRQGELHRKQPACWGFTPTTFTA
jgi:DNA-binding NtrC family response regulator